MWFALLDRLFPKVKRRRDRDAYENRMAKLRLKQRAAKSRKNPE